ncbi:hypothetical protein GOP47_0023690 [Adiantum capillus-veneris]|uniref:MaoC-like domain-containing protein n=1 Tax=Adiantum capillus-veneris TaxID=13818 RepID=A0A9D4U502_ADICA|nr:hypothetical protein GOP47_0023690 [Adiantum capillus-veneris]
MEGTIPLIDPEAVLAHPMTVGKFCYTERDVVLYALGIGACGDDPCDSKELAYVYNEEGQHAVKVLPTFAILYSFGFLERLGTIPGLHFLPSMLLHGEQYLEIYKKLPTNGEIACSSRISQLHDKEKAAVLEIETLCRESQSGEVLCLSRSTVFLRGAGGFSKSNSKLFSYDKRSPSLRPLVKLPVLPSKTAAVTVHEEQTQPNQALLYRLSGDYNPLHSDPEVAKFAGFPRPILHGLCTLGFAVRAVIKHFCNGDPDLVQSIQGRFMLHVFPGETLVTTMWREGNMGRINFLCNVKERSRPVLSGVACLHPSPRL